MKSYPAMSHILRTCAPAAVLSILFLAVELAPGQAGFRRKAEAGPASAATTLPAEGGSGLTVCVYPLRWADAKTAQQAVQSLSGSPAGQPRPPSVMADPRTNSLIVAGMQAQHETVRQVLTAIDVPAREGGLQEVRFYTPRHATPDPALAETIQFLLQSQDRMAYDAARGRVLVNAAPETHQKIADAIAKWEKVSPPASTTTRRVRVVWLVGAPEGDPKAPLALPKDLLPVADELDTAGVLAPRMVAQFMARCSGSAEFRAEGQAEVKGPCQVEIKGQFIGCGPAPALKMSIVARRAGGEGLKDKGAPQGSGTLAAIDTTITAPAGHAVVLGIAPTGELTSAFAVTIYEDKP